MPAATLEASLWDAEDELLTPAVAEMRVDVVSAREVREFVRRYHYSGAAGTAQWRYGLWHGATLWGVMTLNWPTRTVCESVFGREHWASVHHLSRLALADHAPRNSESRLIAGGLRLHSEAHQEVRAVLTYADPLEGHVGYVYQATNALYCGLTESAQPRYVMPDGRVRGTYQKDSRAADGSIFGGHVSRDDAEALGWTVVEGVPKHRYVYLLGSRSQRKWARSMLRWRVVDEYPKLNA